MQMYEMSCGCKLPIIDSTPKRLDGLPAIDLDFYNINKRCGHAWAVIDRGVTKGVFQLEKSLGQTWAQRVQPLSISELSALISLIRPGTLEAITETDLGKKNLTQLYVDRKNAIEPVKYIDPAIEGVLEETLGILVYQEQAMKIATQVAGFSEQDADSLRKAMGKKDAAVMAKVKKMFLEGVEKQGVISKEVGDELFSWIEKSQRYSFNKCIHKDTIIRRPNGGRHKLDLTVEEMYKIRNSIGYAKATGHLSLYKKWKLNGHYGYGLSMFPDGRIRPNIIKDIRFQGNRRCLKITDDGGRSIVVTPNHKFPVPHCSYTKMASELLVGDYWYVCGQYESTTTKYNFSDLQQDCSDKTYEGCGFPSGENNPGYTNGGYSSFRQFKESTPDVCNECGTIPERIETHHIDGNRSNNDWDNLEKLCVSCHKKVEYKNSRTKKGEKGYPNEVAKIVKIEYVGEFDTYDVEMNAPHHNFVVSTDVVTCNSHGVSYAYMGYWSAYVKAHFPLHFYTSWIHFADKKQKPQIEFAELVRDSKQANIDIIIPSVFDIDYNPTIFGNQVGVGLRNLKQAGEKKVIALKDAVNKAEIIVNKHVRDFTWHEMLYHVFDKLNKVLVENIIRAGIVDDFGKSRQWMLYEYKYWNQLTPKQREWIKNWGKSHRSLSENIDRMMRSGSVRMQAKGREKLQNIIKLLENPTSPTEDTIEWLARTEQELYGISLTCHRVQAYEKNVSNCTVQEFLDGYDNRQIIIACEIKEVRYWSPKDDTAKKMAYLTIEDETGGTPNIVVYNDQVKQFENLLYDGNIVYVSGYRQKNRPERLVVNKITQL